MDSMAIFTEREKELLKILAENPELAHRPTELSKLMGWKQRSTSKGVITRLKKKIRELNEANDFLKQLGISPEDAEKW